MLLINILLVDDHVLFSKSLEIALSDYPEIKTFKSIHDISLLDKFIEEDASDIILDFNLRQVSGNMVMESKYNAALAQLQQEEQINLEFSNFLHDNILQDLLSIKNMMHKSTSPEIQKIITQTLDNMNSYIREQMQNYHPVLLSKLTIKENYQNLLTYIAQSLSVFCRLL